MKTYFNITDLEERVLMDLVWMEQRTRGYAGDNYNVQDSAMRTAMSDGAMRTDNYFKI